jgi:hypothetical protein
VVAERIAPRPDRSTANLTGLPTSHICAFDTGYVPAPKRKYGYFTLPILYDNALYSLMKAIKVTITSPALRFA